MTVWPKESVEKDAMANKAKNSDFMRESFFVTHPYKGFPIPQFQRNQTGPVTLANTRRLKEWLRRCSHSKTGNTFLNIGATYPNQTFTGWIPQHRRSQNRAVVADIEGKRVKDHRSDRALKRFSKTKRVPGLGVVRWSLVRTCIIGITKLAYDDGSQNPTAGKLNRSYHRSTMATVKG
jgi:hypothetical protein